MEGLSIDGSSSTQMSVSFAGCGFLGIYHVGVASCLQEYAPHLWSGKVAGASAGALAACALITGCDLGKSTNYVLKIATEARSRALGPLHPSFNVVQRLRVGLESFLPENAHLIASGRLHISLTRVSDMQNVLVSHYNSKEELIQALICSAFVPFYCGLVPPKFQGVRYVDGGLTNNVPELDENTITVSPFAGESDICPNDCSSNFAHISLAGTSIQFTRANLYRLSRSLFPPHPEILSAICQQGFDDALKFLHGNNLISCTRHLNLKSSICATKSGLDLFESDDLSSDSESAYSSESDRAEGVCDTAPHFYCGDDEDSDEDDLCPECHQRNIVALGDTLPPPVVTALQNAVDSVNKGLLTPLYRTRVFHAVSLMTAPWLLPLDITIEMTRRLVDWVPYMPGDMQWFVKEMLRFLGDVYQLVHASSSHYAARFSCQLAITEYSNLSTQPSRLWRGLAAGKTKKPADLQSARHNVNLGFSVDFRPKPGAVPLKMNKIRQQLTASKGGHHRQIRLHDVAEEMEVPASAPLVLASQGHAQQRYGVSSQDTYCSAAYDTYDNYLHVVNQMDSILSFYYTEGNKVRVTEIFALEGDRHAHDSQRAGVSRDVVAM